MAENRLFYAKTMQKILLKESSFSELKEGFNESEKGFANMLIMTALRRLSFIKEDVLPLFVKKKIPAKQKILEIILYLGITELLFMNTPEYAVINSYVEAGKSATDKFGANFINAVLRNVLRHKAELLAQKNTKYFSKDFLKILKQNYLPEIIAEMEKFMSIEPPLDVSIKQGFAFREGGTILPTGSIRFLANTKVKELEGFDDGKWWVQDAASALAVNALFDLKGKKVLDICAAPGGKTAQLLDKGALVTAVDISLKRLDVLKENIERLGLSENLEIRCSDALEFQEDKKFDVVLVDAPCSATGTFRRHPEVIHLKTLDDVKKQHDLQKKILEKAKNFTLSGGLLVYATCSLAKAEGEVVIREFLAKNKDFQIRPIVLNGCEKMQTEEGFLRVFPQHLGEYGGCDGFFIAILQRKI